MDSSGTGNASGSGIGFGWQAIFGSTQVSLHLLRIACHNFLGDVQVAGTAIVGAGDENRAVYIVVSPRKTGQPTRHADGLPHDDSIFTLTPCSSAGAPDPARRPFEVSARELAGVVQAEEARQPRWVWADTAAVYPVLLTAGLRVERCHDLRLSWAILRASSLTAESALARASQSPWQSTATFQSGTTDAPGRTETALFELDLAMAEPGAAASPAADIDPVAELALQLEAVATSADPNRLRLLLAAESAGALIAAEMSHAGLPWREDVHDQLLTELLGPQVAAGLRPARLDELAGQIRTETGVADLNPDSPAEVLRALRFAGLTVTSTRSWELKQLGHPSIAPLLEYKKLARLLSANGWSWMQSWVSNGRFTPEYVPGGVVSGRWATRGGGALQLPKQVRRAVIADDGWKLVVADGAQLEPRILAGISGDQVMAAAGRGTDLYAGIVASGAVATRAEAKVAMLGAMYGATTGESGRLLPRLARAFPTALAFVENAARAGERGEVVTSRLGRSSPRPSESWSETQARASEGAANEAELARARREARDWGRFTRNFVVQASAADWALCWMADLRRALAAFAPVVRGAESAADVRDAAVPGRAAPPFDARPHLVFFLHDEVIVHTPAPQADAVADALRSSAAAATRLLFGTFPLDVPLDLSIVDSYADAA
ncbi:MAG: bifunctional 3-5 exonuclease/DNA polymerase [Subtercola sp.]|nr:bifunctional 3-5 exonuclease/DNA polymerase [Subtercola sp.]